MDFDNFYDDININNELECYDHDGIEQETDKAILVKIKKVNENIWLPKSQIEYDDQYIWVPFWLAEKNNLV